MKKLKVYRGDRCIVSGRGGLHCVRSIEFTPKTFLGLQVGYDVTVHLEDEMGRIIEASPSELTPYMEDLPEISLVRIEDQIHLAKYENPSQKFHGHMVTTDTPIMFMREGKLVHSDKWFINENRELIYDVKHNNWVNLEMYAERQSYAKDIFVVETVNPYE